MAVDSYVNVLCEEARKYHAIDIDRKKLDAALRSMGHSKPVKGFSWSIVPIKTKNHTTKFNISYIVNNAAVVSKGASSPVALVRDIASTPEMIEVLRNSTGLYSLLGTMNFEYNSRYQLPDDKFTIGYVRPIFVSVGMDFNTVASWEAAKTTTYKKIIGIFKTHIPQKEYERLISLSMPCA